MKTALNVIFMICIILSNAFLFLMYLKLNQKDTKHDCIVDKVYEELNSMKFKVDLTAKKFETSAKRFSSIENDVDRIGAKIRKLDKHLNVDTTEEEK